jgi:plastocyanin
MLFAALSTLALATVAAAQDQIIQVGATSTTAGGAFQFIPPNVNATNGSVITFQFTGVPGNHSVTQSSFASPCNIIPGGFDSGWVQILTAQTEVTEWNLTVTDDTRPIWFYCKQLKPSPHCEDGMVGAINAAGVGNKTFQVFQANAKLVTGPSGQGVGFLEGVGASASIAPSPLPSGVTNFGAPTPGAASASASATSSAATGSAATGSAAASGSSTESGSTPASTSAASRVAVSFIVVLFAAALGFIN